MDVDMRYIVLKSSFLKKKKNNNEFMPFLFEIQIQFLYLPRFVHLSRNSIRSWSFKSAMDA